MTNAFKNKTFGNIGDLLDYLYGRKITSCYITYINNSSGFKCVKYACFSIHILYPKDDSNSTIRV